MSISHLCKQVIKFDVTSPIRSQNSWSIYNYYFPGHLMAFYLTEQLCIYIYLIINKLKKWILILKVS